MTDKEKLELYNVAITASILTMRKILKEEIDNTNLLNVINYIENIQRENFKNAHN